MAERMSQMHLCEYNEIRDNLKTHEVRNAELDLSMVNCKTLVPTAYDSYIRKRAEHWETLSNFYSDMMTTAPSEDGQRRCEKWHQQRQQKWGQWDEHHEEQETCQLRNQEKQCNGRAWQQLLQEEQRKQLPMKHRHGECEDDCIMDGDQFNQFVATMTALPDRQGWKFTDFKGIVSPLIPAEQKNNPKFAPDAVNWLVNANRLLTTADCPAKWKVALATDSLPLEKANRYYADCEQDGLDPTVWANFEKFVAENYSNAVNYVDAFFRLMNMSVPNSVATLDTYGVQVEQFAKAAKLCDQATMLLFLWRLPQGVISRVLMEAKNSEPIRIGAVKTLAANHFGSLAMASHSAMEVDAIQANAPPVETDALRGGYRGQTTFPSYNSVRDLISREQYEDRRKRDVCLACGDAKHTLRKCPQRGPKGQQN
ncbi:hypothetical protein H4R20_002587 [Coemansia guatemalensis]|uniref:Uncharacterized protein n=1 Tax=Coemansia guatemalensis TaxID=2761395 RepID=A0A9W8I3I6_9FUNG|nr:hypothetical protein H4R20_002587 [Coemansia guatemalensis]